MTTTSTSVYIREVDYLVYDIGFHDRLFETEEEMFTDFDGDTLPEMLEYHADMKCIAIYDCGQPIFEDLDEHPELEEFIGNNKFFSGIVIVPIDAEKVHLYKLEYVKDAMKALGHCSNVGNVYAMRFEQHNNITVLTIYDDTS